MFRNQVTLYNPAEKDKQTLVDEFVVRVNIFNRIIKDIRSSENLHPEQHYLLVGQRGAGKTTLLYRLKYEIEDSPELSIRLLPINLGEEQYSISELSDLWECLSEILDDYFDFKSLAKEVYSIRHGEDKSEVEPRMYNLLAKSLDNKKQSIVLFIDNFGDLLNKFNEHEMSRLREILMTEKHIRLIAGTPVTLESIFNYSEPFFEFFKILELKGLNESETKRLLIKLGESHGEKKLIEKIIEEKPERIEILRRLTGGVIRTMVLLFKVFMENTDGSSLRDLQMVLDSVTPLYKHRMDDLPTQQQKIVDAVAKNWDGIAVKELTKKTRLPSKTISSQLRQLEKNQVVQKKSTGSKNHLYQLKERFFNIWYLMRYGRKYDQKRVIWLVRFLESWCDQDELETRVRDHINDLNSADTRYDKNSALLIGEAYLACKVNSEVKERLIETISLQYPTEFDKTRYNLSAEKLKEAINLLKSGEKSQALKKLKNVEINGENYKSFVSFYLEIEDYNTVEKIIQTIDSAQNATAFDFLLLGGIYHDPETKEVAFNYYQKAIELDASIEEPYIRKANLLHRYYKDYKKAESCLNDFLKLAPSKKGEYYHELAHIQVGQKHLKEAEESFKLSIDNGRLNSNFCLGAFYHYQVDLPDKAEDHYLKSIESGSEPYFNLGVLFAYSKNDYEKAISYFETALESGVNDAYYELGKIYKNHLRKPPKARHFYEKAIEVNDTRAYHPLAHLYAKLKSKKKQAEKLYEKAIEIGDSYAGPCLAMFYFVEERQDKKNVALQLISTGKKELPNEMFIYEFSSRINLWNDDFEAALKDLENLVSSKDYLEDEIEDITDLIIDFISLELHYPVLKLLDNEEYQLKDLMKPIYYALMTLMKDDLPNEYLKMGNELAETVSEILQEIDNRKMEFS
ncbi:tetratricopeptide repeat protein [Roseivirga sp. E12]|uniref:tetratricopeptide repeat protein n=1 Tax=Roseivirga sp. E12 TaxID=2819237 RepID=UPI001ABC3896|nr:tetratricopeptide repeat protein [Roseivirga sp. E12]MBO3697302.1 tetratricopeptide repeat protein [Roseivirga sp. E12]